MKTVVYGKNDEEFFFGTHEHANEIMRDLKPLHRRVDFISDEIYNNLMRQSDEEIAKVVCNALMTDVFTICNN